MREKGTGFILVIVHKINIWEHGKQNGNIDIVFWNEIHFVFSKGFSSRRSEFRFSRTE